MHVCLLSSTVDRPNDFEIVSEVCWAFYLLPIYRAATRLVKKEHTYGNLISWSNVARHFHYLTVDTFTWRKNVMLGLIFKF